MSRGFTDLLPMPTEEERAVPPSGLMGAISAISPALGPVGAGLGLVSNIAQMRGAHQAQKEAEEQQRKNEALQRAGWMSSRQERWL